MKIFFVPVNYYVMLNLMYNNGIYGIFVGPDNVKCLTVCY